MIYLDEYVLEQFDFLKGYGYVVCARQKDQFSFEGENNAFEVYIDRYGFQIDSYFKRGEDSFDANWAIEFAGLDSQEFMATYQYHGDEGLKTGISRISRSIMCLMNKIDMSKKESFDMVLDYVNNKEEEAKKEYQIKTDLHKAEQCWKEKRFEEAGLLYEKHFDSLRPSQRKRLEIIRKS